uniref:A-kinase anchor protein 12-like n=1 Tax=Acanthochromis polyacanthus TaxID=80966 RepID=A0A3Q1EYQ7_9TELE
MGDAQSAQRDAQKDAEPGEDVQTEQSTEDKPLENKEPISELNGKADGTLAGFNGHSVDAAEDIPSPDKDVPNVEISANKPDEEADVPVKTIEMEAKQNEINEGFKRFFNNIGLKLTVKKGSAEKGEIQVPEEEPNKEEDIKDTTKESENAEQNKELNAAQEAYDNDSTTGPTMTDGTSEDLLDTETKMEAESNKADAARSSHGSEGGHQEAAPEDVVPSPFKRFSLQLKTGFFSGLRKKKEPAEKELVDMGKKEDATEQTVQDQQQDKVEDETATVWQELKEMKPKDVSAASAQTTDEAKSPSTDPSAIIATESEILSSQEKVQASPMKRLLSGSSLKKLSKKQRGRKLSDGRLSDSGEHSSDHLMSSTESADNPREDSSPQSSADATGEEEGPWASFKKLMTPKKRSKGSSSGHEETQVPASGHEAKPRQGEQTSDHSSEEGRKRKDSSVSWEAVLCGSGRRRSRKTSDSEDESPQNDNADNKQDSGAKQGAETQLENSNKVHETLASSTRQVGSLPEGDGGSTWQSFKKLVTPKRKAKDEDEGKDKIHSDSEITQDDSSFSIKKLLPGRKKRKSGERQDQVSSDEAEKEVASGDEDSETPAVVPLSEFDTAETGIQIQTQADIESDTPKELEDNLKQDDMSEPVVPCDDRQTEATTVQKKEEALKNEASTAPVTNEEPDEELISKHQQLSDITEEGAITDTMATPASTNEEAARDDTIAEDLIEITSEAITAPEPVDVTLADETEMISAVSQLSESSKTSGNTTPVPAELDVKDTELLLQNVVENIQMSQDAVPVCSDDPSSEKARPDVEAIDAPQDLVATAQPESVSDTYEAMSTDIISEVLTEEFDTAEITTDDVYKEDVSQLQDTISELEVSEESQHKEKFVPEVNEAVPVETLPEGEEVVPHPVVEADEAEISKMDSQDTEPAPAIAEGPKDGAVVQEIQSLAEKEDQIQENVPEQFPFEDQPAVVADKQEELETVETNKLASEKSDAQSLEKNVPISEDILPAENVTSELKQTAEHLTGVTENKEPQSDAPKIDQHEAIVDSEDGSVQSLEKEVPPEDALLFPEVSVMLVEASKTERIQEQEALQAVVLDREVSSPESLAKEVISEDVPPEETVTDEPKEETVPLVEDNVAPVDTPKTEHIQKTEASQAVEDATLNSEGVLEKEVISEDAPSEEMARNESKEEPVPLAEGNVESVDASRTELIREPETLQTATLDSKPDSPELPQKDVISEDVPPEETARDEPKEEPVALVKVNVEPVDAPKTEHIQEPETLQATTLDSEVSSPELPQKEVIPEEVPSEETVREEPEKDTVLLAGVNVEPVDASKTEHIQEPETLQATTLDSEASCPELPQKEVISEDVPSEETMREEPKEDTVLLAEVNVEPVDASKIKHVQEPEVLQAATLDSEASSPESLEKEVMSEDVPPAETVKDETKKETVPLAEVNVESVDASEEPEVLQTVQETTANSELSGPQLLEKKDISEDVQVKTVTDEPKQAPEVSTELEKPPVEPEISAPDVKEVVTETETGAAASSVEECNAQEKQIPLDDVTKPAGEDVIASVQVETEIKAVDQALERNSYQKTESLSQSVEVEVEDSTTEAVEELETTTAVNVPSVMEEASCVQILEETVLSKETPEPCVDSAEASDEPTREVHINGIGDQINGLPSAEMKTAEVQHVVVMQVTTCNLKDEIPSVFVEKTSETHEPLIDRMAGETELKEGVESAAPLVEDSVEVEDNHRIQVQKVDVDIKSLLEVGVTEDTKVTDVCQETTEKVEVLSATSGIEDEVFNKETKAAVQGDIPNVKENLPRTIPESLVVSLEQEILKVALTEVVANVSNQARNQEEINNGTEKFMEGQDEGSAVPSDGGAIPTEHHDSHLQTSDIPGDLDVSVPDQKEDLEETKADEICPSEELAVKKVIENTTEAQQTTQIVTTSNTGLVTQQNTGTISSLCNMESPTSFSFEVKFNIQFEKTKVPESPTSPTETLKPVKQTDVSEVGIQVVEAVAPINATERDEKQITEPPVNLDSNKMTKITSQAAQLDVGIRAVETITPVEEITSTETATPNIQAAETIQPETQAESREVFLSQPLLGEAKAKEPIAEDNDVWQDAEEEIFTQQPTEKEQDEKAEHGQEAQQETHKTEGTPEIESEGEHFVAALEHPETVTAGDMTMDLN